MKTTSDIRIAAFIHNLILSQKIFRWGKRKLNNYENIILTDIFYVTKYINYIFCNKQ